jgi:hypothetical protein
MLSGLHGNSRLYTGYRLYTAYYPSTKYLNLTMVDLGEGFLDKISKVTSKNESPITTAKEAVIWAVNGNSIKPYTNLINISSF